MGRDGGDWRDHLDSETQMSAGARAPWSEAGVPGLTVLCHPDPERVGEEVTLAALLSGRSERLSRLEPLFAPPVGGEPRPLADPHLSRRPLELAPAPDSGIVLERGEAAIEVLAGGRPVERSVRLSAGQVDEGVVLILGRRVVLALHRMGPATRRPPAFGLVGESAPLVRVRREIERVADLPHPVLLRGETGTGKELVARAIHEGGPRAGRPCVSVNLGAIPPNLAAAELFGAARGAFTGAGARRRGYFRRADGGTLFLDEVGETPAEVQVLLLRVLESGEIQPLGVSTPERVDVRVLSATDADLDAAIAGGRFHAPLLHRLATFQIELPPLRRRREDFGRLFFHFLRRELAEVGDAGRLAAPEPGGRPFVPVELVGRLASFDWPGNVRQLLNVVRQLAAASRGEAELRVPAQVEEMLAGGGDRPRRVAPVRPAAPPPPRYRDPADVGGDELVAALAAQRWNVQRTAGVLGISRTSLYELIDKHPGVRKAGELGREEIERCRERCAGRLDAMVDELRVSKRGLQMRMKELGLS